MNALLHFGGRPLLACLLLSAIHVRFGRDLAKRGESFAALALPQCAALGAAVSLFLGKELHSIPTALWSTAFALAGALVLSCAAGFQPADPPPPERRLEAGATRLFAGAAAAMALVLSRTVAGGDHLGHLIGGDLLPVSMREIAVGAIVFATVAAIRKFVKADFIAVAIVAGVSVPTAGVLLVFAYLAIAPALARRFATAWPAAALISTAGVCVALLADLPAGATIVCAFVIVLLGMQAA